MSSERREPRMGVIMRLITAMVKVTGAFQKSSEIMKATSQLIKLPQFSATMREMSMEMMKVCLCLFCYISRIISVYCRADDSLG